jgi:hypothetical protein
MSMKDISPDNELPEDIKLPDPLATAFLAERPELCRLWEGPMDAETAKAMAHAMGVILAKNRHLRAKLARVRQVIEDGIITTRGQLNAVARKVLEVDVDAVPELVEEET